MNEALTLVGIAHEQYRLAMGQYHQRRNGYIAAIEYAREQGASYAAIGKVAGITRQKVYRLLHGE